MTAYCPAWSYGFGRESRLAEILAAGFDAFEAIRITACGFQDQAPRAADRFHGSRGRRCRL
jgi:hypothetical protein